MHVGRSALALVALACAAAPLQDALAESTEVALRDEVATATPATRPAAKVLEVLGKIAENITETRYEHRTRVRASEGIYVWDCSAMAAYVLRRAAPTARRALTRERPVARDFYAAIEAAPTRGDREGWRKVATIDDVRPGDVFAWKRPKDFPSRNTGHVGFVLEPQRPAAGWPGAYLVRIADATSLPHDDDTRDPEGGGGFGHGTLLVLSDGAGKGIAYGWFGARSRGVIVTPIAFGRLIR